MEVMVDTATDTEAVEALEITGASTLVATAGTARDAIAVTALDACDRCMSRDSKSVDVGSDR